MDEPDLGTSSPECHLSRAGEAGRTTKSTFKTGPAMTGYSYRMCTSRLVVTTLALLVCAAHAQDTTRPRLSPADPRFSELATKIEAEYAKDGLGSMTVGVVSGGELVWTKTVGFADPFRRRPASTTTVYRIGSVTKLITGAMLCQLVERGVVRLGDPVGRYYSGIAQVPGGQFGADSISLLQLATMTSGLSREPANSERYITGRLDQWENVLDSALPSMTREFAPRTRRQYSNVGYAILGAALANAAGKSYVNYVRQEILRPLEMRHTDFELSDAMRRELAVGNAAVGERGLDTTISDREHKDGRGYRVPSGGLYSTLGDLARFLAYHQGLGPDGVPGRTVIARAREGLVASERGLQGGYGQGFEVYRRGNLTWIGHAGGVVGYQAIALYDPTTNIGFIGLRSASGGKARLDVFTLDALTLLTGGVTAQAGR
jgi:CubicO group peptidase (beta-lactamase class C family)